MPTSQASFKNPLLAIAKMSNPRRSIERRILSLLHGRETRTCLREIHAHFLRHGLHRSPRILAHFVSVCAAANQTAHARRVFEQTPNPDAPLFNAMIKAHSLSGPFEHSLHLFSAMKRGAVSPDELTFAPLLKACSNLRDYRVGRFVWSHVVRAGFEPFGSVRIGIVELCVSCLMMEDAKKVFDEMGHRDVIVWNLMVRGFCNSGDVDAGIRLFRQMTERSIVSWNSMISCLARNERDSEALGLFAEMRSHGCEPDDATVVTVLPVCARLGSFEIGRWLHSYADNTGLLREFVSVGNSLVAFYSKCGDSDSALSVFYQIRRKDVISYNAMISGSALNGENRRGIELFNEMVNQGIKPNSATFTGILVCCARSGLVEKGREIFASMARFHRKPELEHYGCMVDLLGRNGLVDEAHNLIRSMPMKPNAAIWGSLLGSCRTSGKSELAETSISELIELEPWNSGNFVLLSNLYAEEGRWDMVEKVRDMMKVRCVTKAPGQSAIGLE